MSEPLIPEPTAEDLAMDPSQASYGEANAWCRRAVHAERERDAAREEIERLKAESEEWRQRAVNNPNDPWTRFKP